VARARGRARPARSRRRGKRDKRGVTGSLSPGAPHALECSITFSTQPHPRPCPTPTCADCAAGQCPPSPAARTPVPSTQNLAVPATCQSRPRWGRGLAAATVRRRALVQQPGLLGAGRSCAPEGPRSVQWAAAAAPHALVSPAASLLAAAPRTFERLPQTRRPQAMPRPHLAGMQPLSLPARSLARASCLQGLRQRSRRS
jgi:hypothetical protein